MFRKCCSHTAGLCYKINEAATKGYIGVVCTDKANVWNSSTSQNILPDTVENICTKNSTKCKFVCTTVIETDADLIRHMITGKIAKLAAIPGNYIEPYSHSKGT